MLVQAVYNVVDRFFVGWGVGDLGVAGITVVFPYMLIFMAFGMLIGIGGAAAFSIFLGQKRETEARLTFGNSLTMTVIISLILSAVGILFTEPLLKLFGASENVIGPAKDYMSIIAFGGLFQTISFAMNNFIRAQGSPITAMLTLLIGAALNTILDPIFIFVFGWGVGGAALATVISMIVSSIWVMAGLFNTPMGKKLTLQDLIPSPKILLRVFTIGVAPFFMQVAASVLNAILNTQLSFYGGDWALTSIGVIFSIAMLFLMPIFGLNQGTQPLIGFNYGAQFYDRVRKLVLLTTVSTTLVTLLGFLAALFAPRILFAFFLPKNPEILDRGSQALTIFFLAFPLIGSQIAGVGYFQAIGKAAYSMILSLSRQVLFLIPLILILPRFFGISGVWYSIPIADTLAFLITGFLLIRELAGLKNQHLEKNLNSTTPGPLENIKSADALGNAGEIL